MFSLDGLFLALVVHLNLLFETLSDPALSLDSYLQSCVKNVVMHSTFEIDQDIYYN